MSNLTFIDNNLNLSLTTTQTGYDLLKSLEEYWGMYLEDGDIKPSTLKRYMQHIATYYTYCQQERLDPPHANQEDIRGYRSYLRNNYKHSTVKLKLQILRQFFQRAIDTGYRHDNPARGIKAKRVEDNPEDQIKYLDIETVQKLFSSIKLNTNQKVRDYTILHLMYLNGLRVIEVSRLNLDSIEGNRLRIHGKNDKTRYDHLLPEILELINKWLTVRERYTTPEELALFIATSNNHRGKRISTRSIRSRVDHYLKRIGAKREGISCHSLRHSMGTHLATKEVDMRIIQSKLGHSDEDMTRIYTKISQKHMIENNPSRILYDLLVGAHG